MEEVSFQCPYCWQNQSVLVDISAPEQDFIEDCMVCCRPIRFLLTIHFDTVGAYQIDLHALHEDE